MQQSEMFCFVLSDLAGRIRVWLQQIVTLQSSHKIWQDNTRTAYECLNVSFG